jgi:hypothetical protein
MKTRKRLTVLGAALIIGVSLVNPGMLQSSGPPCPGGHAPAPAPAPPPTPPLPQSPSALGQTPGPPAPAPDMAPTESARDTSGPASKPAAATGPQKIRVPGGGSGLVELTQGTNPNVLDPEGYVMTGTLAADTNLIVKFPGGGSLPVAFASGPGTYVTFDGEGYAVFGTLAREDSFTIPRPGGGTTTIKFSAGSQIMINHDGVVTTGTLYSDDSLPIKFRGRIFPVVLKGGTRVVLNDNGTLKSGTLAQAMELPTKKGRRKSMKRYEAGTSVSFDGKGYVTDSW